MNEFLLFLCMFMNNVTTTLSILSPIIILGLKILNINMYTISKKDKINIILNKLDNYICTSYTDENNPYGIILTQKYNIRLLIYIPEVASKYLILFTTQQIMNELVLNDYKRIIHKINVSIEEDKNKAIDYWHRTGDYSYFEYIRRKMYINEYEFNIQQEQIYKNIMKIYNEKNNVKCFIYGKVNSGKSILSYLIARKLSCNICDTFNPTEPSDMFSNLYYSVNPSSKNPLIVLLDEVDIVLTNLHNEKIRLHKNNATQIYNKTTWNNFLDKIDYGLYPNVILILCSNVSIHEINKMDESYLRQGRIDLIQNLIKV